ncbi:MAG: hypothetical protein A2W99_14310 [Bacteroidetes bacterium GWF2_33_16]|nr:MAG: hypothetical protein A2X00_06240 [Bacteroidetes bacterium GWE2_32_14]OFY04798.1 MAG: hypothetical protein A2W99_14310 [Bacteroidetes bacterium GWF2_33_16]
MKTGFSIFITFSVFIAVSCLSEMPDSISSDVTLNTSVAFPLGETSLGLNDISGFDERLLDENPLTGKPFWKDSAEVILSYSMPFDIGDIYQTSEEIIQLTFRLNMYNGFPSTVRGQFYFLDPYGFIQDSLFQDGPVELKKATASDNGKITFKPHEKKDIAFDSNRLDNLQSVNKIRIYLVFSTSDVDDELVQYYDEYLVDVQIGVKATLKFDL